MKVIIFTALLMISNLAIANSVTCVDDDDIWDVSFKLEGELARDIVFKKFGAPFMEFGEHEVKIATIRLPYLNRGTIFYEINLGGAKYLDFERNFRGNHVQSLFPAVFLLAKTPFSVEDKVYCTLK